MLRIADNEPLQPRQSSPSTILYPKKQTSPQMQVQHNPLFPTQSSQQLLISQLQSINKLSVEEIFKHAKNTETTPIKADGQTNYCMQLLQMFHSKGLGIPQYSHISNIADGSVSAEVVLPDKRSFTGKSSFSRKEASESAALLAFDYVSCNGGSIYAQNIHHFQSSTIANIGFMAGKPGTNKLPVPPQQWYSHQQQFRNYHFNRQGDWWQGADVLQQQYNHQQQPSCQDMSPIDKSEQYTGHPQNSQQVPRPSVEESQCQFVPLQAFKQQRSKAGGVAPSCPQQAQEVDLTQQIEQNLNISESKHTINKENESVHAAPNVVAQKPLMVRPRKSRIAANFNIKPITEQ